jgi:hypothetical protein
MRSKWVCGAGFSSLAVIAIAGLSGSYVVPLEHEAIQYATRPLSDPVARLEKRIAAGEAKLEFEPKNGYLKSILRELKIPVDSQVLVFSKTSLQAQRISPRTPRALYFNDNASVGFVKLGEVLEVASVDPEQGVIFYAVEQDGTAKPRFERRDTCLQCHAAGGTLGVPGLMVRSVYPEPSGMPLFQAGSFVTDHRSPWKERWGGWYVTGKHGSQVHMGNAVVRDRQHPDQLETENTQNVQDLTGRFDVADYLTPHSDVVALLALEHQTHMTNLITRVGYEARMALHSQAAIDKALGRTEGGMSESTTRRINLAADELVEYLLFTDEDLLTEPIEGTSGFTASFPREGPRDRKGRSLRDLDLKTRLLKYPCSYLIYSDAFDRMPVEARERVYRRLWEVLTGADKSTKFARLTADDRRAILEILLDTKKNLPAYWQRG